MQNTTIAKPMIFILETVADFGEDSKHAGITIPNADGSDAKEIVPSGSPAGKMVKQLETLKKKEQKK